MFPVKNKLPIEVNKLKVREGIAGDRSRDRRDDTTIRRENNTIMQRENNATMQRDDNSRYTNISNNNFMTSIQGLEQREQTQFATYANNTASAANNITSFPNINTANMNLPEVANEMNNIMNSYNFSFFKVSPNPEAAISVHKQCVMPEENSDKVPITMKRLDNFYHTPDSCKINSTLQGYKYYSLVKSTNTSANPNQYECHVSNDELPSSLNTFAYPTIWSMGPTVNSFSLNNNGDIIINANDPTKLGPYKYKYSTTIADYSLGDANTFIQGAPTSLDVNVFDITQVFVKSCMIGGGTLQTPLPATGIYLLNGTNDTYIAGSYDGAYHRMVSMKFIMDKVTNNLSVVALEAKYSKLARYVRIISSNYGEKWLQISSLVVNDYTGNNVTLNKSLVQVYAKDVWPHPSVSPQNVINGDIRVKPYDQGFHSGTPYSWLEIDLGVDTHIQSISYYNREGYQYRNAGATLEVISSAGEVLKSFTMNADNVSTYTMDPGGSSTGDATVNAIALNNMWNSSIKCSVATTGYTASSTNLTPSYGICNLQVTIAPQGLPKGTSSYKTQNNTSFVSAPNVLSSKTNTSLDNCYSTCDSDPTCLGFTTSNNNTQCNFVSVGINGTTQPSQGNNIFSRNVVNAPYSPGDYNLTNNSNNFDTSVCANNACLFSLQLSNDGNLTLYRIMGTDKSVIWDLFSFNSNVSTTLSTLSPISNPQWVSQNVQYGNSMSVGDSLPNKTCIISPNGMFKFQVQNGYIVLKTNVYGCKSTDSTYSNINAPLYTTSNNGYYVYENRLGEPKLNNIYYQTTSPTGNVLKQIANDSPLLQFDNKYYQYAGVQPGTDVDMTTAVNGNLSDCEQKCNTDPTCGYFYVSNSNGQSVCVTGNKENNQFIPNQTNPDDINTSSKYVRYQKINLNNVYTHMNPDVQFNNSAMPYATYPVGSPVSTSSDIGIPDLPSTSILKAREDRLRIGDHGLSMLPTIPIPPPGGQQGFKNRIEGFNSNGYTNAVPNCTSHNPQQGCQPSILYGQIQPLQQISADYGKQNDKINQNFYDISNNINQYYALRNKLHNNSRYDFNSNQPFMQDAGNSLSEEMQKDSQLMALKLNNLYIAGSILTTTLLVSAIYLGRK
jgi:hypothetical protein